MLGCGCLLLAAGFVVKVVAGFTFPPLAIVGIGMMMLGWKGVIAGSTDQDRK